MRHRDENRARRALPRAAAFLGAAAALLGGAARAQNGGSVVPPSTPLAVQVGANQVGRLTSVGNGQTRRFYQYDALGRPTRVEHRPNGVQYVFSTTYGYPQNAAGTTGPGNVVLGLTFPDGEQVAYGYDAGDQSQTVVATPAGGVAQTIVSAMRRNARGQTLEVDYGNGAVTTHSYNDAGDLRLHEIRTVGAGAGTAQDYVYGFDANGNVTSVSDTVVPSFSATYGYDTLDQLTSMVSGGSRSYGYDEAGDLISKDGVAQTYGGAGRGPHALAAANGISYGYDASGNLVTASNGFAFTWDANNMATRAMVGGVVSNRKSFLGEELWKKVEGAVTTLYLPSLRIENGQARKFFGVFAERSPDGGLRFYHGDHLGSSTVVTDSQQAVVHRIAYFPFGEDRGAPAGSFTPAYQFNFKEKDATGLYDYGARLYSPVTGRWLSPDSSLDASPNRYTYVSNNPLLYNDPTGHQEVIVRNGQVLFFRCDDECKRERRQKQFAQETGKVAEFVLRTEAMTLSFAPGLLGWAAFATDLYLTMKDGPPQNQGEIMPFIILALEKEAKIPPSLLRKVGARFPRNAKKWAGKVYEKLPDTLTKRYPNVRYTPTGYADLSPYAIRRVTIRMTGTSKDFGLANLAAGFGPSTRSWQEIDGVVYTWHHSHDKATMMLVPKELHDAVPHTGGAARVRYGGTSSAFGLFDPD